MITRKDIVTGCCHFNSGGWCEDHPGGNTHNTLHNFCSEVDKKLTEAVLAVFKEALRASSKHPPMNSHHEAYAVILEEIEEYWREVQKGGSIPRDPEALRTELIQAAAMCVRGLMDLC